jgi:hypothetical protein
MIVQHRYNPNFDKMMERDSYRRMDYGYHQRRNEMAENYRPPPRLGGRIFHNDTIPDILQEFLNKLFFVKSSAIRAYDIAYIRGKFYCICIPKCLLIIANMSSYI